MSGNTDGTDRATPPPAEGLSVRIPGHPGAAAAGMLHKKTTNANAPAPAPGQNERMRGPELPTADHAGVDHRGHEAQAAHRHCDDDDDDGSQQQQQQQPYSVDETDTNVGWMSAEEVRLEEDGRKERHWKRWGPYLSERQWATVREDYSANGDAWTHFPHEQARSRAYRWGEDGIGGISDNHQRLCFSVGLWNGKDRILKERLFGVTGHEGNHGEDVKEVYWYLDSTPTHSYMKYLYKYPQAAFPYEQLVRESQHRSRDVDEFEITDTDMFDEDRYWDIYVEYAKDADNENGMSIRITAYNRGPEPADLHILPQLWFRNTWSWGKEGDGEGGNMPNLRATGESTIAATHPTLGQTHLYATASPAPSPPVRSGRRFSDGEAPPSPEPISEEIVTPDLLFTENETNFERLWGGKNRSFAKDAFHDHIIPSHRPPGAHPIKKTRKVKKTITKRVPRVRRQANDAIASQTREGESSGMVNGKVNGGEEPSSSLGLGSSEEDEFDEVPEEVQEDEEYEEMPESPRVAYVNPEKSGTKAGAHYVFHAVPAKGGCAVVRLKLTPRTPEEDSAIMDDEKFDAVVEARRYDADEFYARLAGGPLSEDLKNIQRQALAGMLWSKQFYMFIQQEWIKGDPGQPPPPPERKYVRNREWKHLYIDDILSMPDKWEYPFFAVWDTAFHTIPLAMVDPAFAKKQLDLFTREWYMKPDGQIPAYEWNFSDVNPPVHAWATFRVFKVERKLYGREDLDFLERVFQKLLLNFTWWVNRKDKDGNNVFEGGFLGLDNIGPFNRSEPLPTGGVLRQADGTAWMAFFCLNMLNMALELAKHNPTYEDIASKFFEHFIFIADAMTFKDSDDDELSLWNEKDGFYYDAISWGEHRSMQIPVRSLVGLIPLFATLTLEPIVLKRFPGFAKRMQWFIDHRPDLAERNISNMAYSGKADRRLLAMVNKDRLVSILQRMLDESEFLSQHGVRSLSRYHKDHPWSTNVNGEEFGVGYWPGESHSGMFGGNSNWRGPIWLAVNFLLIESLQRFYQFYGDSLKVKCPTSSGDYMHLGHVAEEIQHRLINIFSRDDEMRRACNGGDERFDWDPYWRDHVLFHEYFNADDGRGLGASHQTGWTGLIAFSIMQSGLSYRLPRTPRTPRSQAAHYFDEHLDGVSDLDTRSEADAGSVYSMALSFSRPPSPEEL